MNREENVLGNDFSTGGLLVFALPTMVMMVFLGLYTMVDTVFVSRFVSTDALGAINIVTPVINLVVGLGTMLAAGGNAIISRTMGEGDCGRARESFTMLVFCGGAAGTVLAALGFVMTDEILEVLGAGGGLFEYAKEYLRILLVFFPAYMLQTMFANLFVTAGHPGLGSFLSVGSGILNLVLDYVFIVVLDMGIQGAALGTGFGYLMPTAAGLWFFGTQRRETLHFCRISWDIRVLAESCANGSSEMVSQLAMAVTCFLFNRNMMRLAGEDGVAAITIINYSQFLLNTLFMGFSMGVAPVLGYHFGRGDGERLKRILRSCLKVILWTCAGVFLTAYFGGGRGVNLFAREGGRVYVLAAEGFRLFSVSFLFCGVNIFASSMFTALSNGKVSAFVSFLRTFAFLTVGIIALPRLWGIRGIWLAVPLAEGAAFLVSVRFLKKEIV